MNVLGLLRRRFAEAVAPLAADPGPLVDLVRPSQDPQFGDYQANLAMPLGKQLGRPPREVAAEVLAHLALDDLCEPPQIAGPGFINLRLRRDWLEAQLEQAVSDPRLGIAPVAEPRTVIVDYSAPNVAKPMHVGHIRSTVIGDALVRILRFQGHRVIGDNHVGDWGTQFGMIIFGYRNFVDRAAYERAPVTELARLYRLVNRLVDYHDGVAQRGSLAERAAQRQAALEQFRQQHPGPPGSLPKPAAGELRKLEAAATQARQTLEELDKKLASVEADPQLGPLARQYPGIGRSVLEETAKLHAGDAENRRLWSEFVPLCLEDIDRIYRRLGVQFDKTLGESFYHDRLPGVVADLRQRGLAVESDGAVCVFIEGIAAPMIVQKQDGAYLYATTDLATIAYRQETWRPDAILYVVDHRQGLHFEQLFATARRWGFQGLELAHVSFGTVLGDDGRPYKTRSGDTVGLEGLLDEAVSRAAAIVTATDDAQPQGSLLSPEERQRVAETVGIAALKYADLSQNRTSDYVFSYDKMLAMTGNTATYMQYAYARINSIFARGQVDIAALRQSKAKIHLEAPAERALGLALVRFEEALAGVLVDYRPNQLTQYLFELANAYSTFFEQCPVLRADTTAERESRLLLCDLTARTIRQGLDLLGIGVVEKM